MTIWPFIFGFIFLIFFGKVLNKCWWGDFFRKFKLVLAGIVGFSFSVFLGIFLSMFIGYFLPVRFTKVESYKLTYLFDDSNEIFLTDWLNYYDNQHYILYRRDDEDNSVERIQYNDNVAVFEEDQTDGEFMVYRYQFTNFWFNWIAWKQYDRKNYYTFSIPEGSLLNL